MSQSKKPKECTLCCNPIKNEVKLSCNHIMCLDCVIKWKKNCTIFNCPFCRKKILEEKEEKKNPEFSPELYMHEILSLIKDVRKIEGVRFIAVMGPECDCSNCK